MARFGTNRGSAYLKNNALISEASSAANRRPAFAVDASKKRGAARIIPAFDMAKPRHRWQDLAVEPLTICSDISSAQEVKKRSLEARGLR